MRNIDCSVGRGWEALCSPIALSTAEASGGDQEPGRAEPSEGKNKEIEGSRRGVPLSQAPGSLGAMCNMCDMCDTGALDQPMSPRALHDMVWLLLGQKSCPSPEHVQPLLHPRARGGRRAVVSVGPPP